jgi:hypothetical protein
MSENKMLGLVRGSAVLAVVITFNAQFAPVLAQETVFTYQGKLTEDEVAYTGSAEFRATLWDAEADGNQVAVNTPEELVVAVANGLFTLPLDFGDSFSGGERWLQLEVRTDIGVFTPLNPRQLITSTPYAITAGTVTGVVSAQQLSGTLRSVNISGDYGNPVTFSHPDNSFSGNAKALTGLNASELTSGTVSEARLPASVARANQVWLLGGNAGTQPAAHYLGTADAQPLQFKVNGSRVLRLEDNGDSTDTDTIPDGAPNLIGGADVNYVAARVVGATIGGGGAKAYYGLAFTNSVSANFGVVAGGVDNRISGGASHSAISGGRRNSVGPDAGYSLIGGGNVNRIESSASKSVIAGGEQNGIGPNATGGAIGGGEDNTVGESSSYATVSGGLYNNLGIGSSYSTIGGGLQSSVKDGAEYATVAGGHFNYVSEGAAYGAVGGGSYNYIGTDAQYAVVPGGQWNRAGEDHSFAAGRRANAEHEGAFVWADSTDANFESDRNNQFKVRANGGAHIVGSGNFAAPQLHLQQTTSGHARLRLTAGTRPFWDIATGGTWGALNFYSYALRADVMTIHTNGNVTTYGSINPPSDRNMKRDFEPVDSSEVLEKVVAMPIESWAYKNSPEIRHIGPVAQDFHGAFQVGTDGKHIATVDADGVALAAIKGLNQKLEAELKAKDAEIEALKQAVAELHSLIEPTNP